MQNISKGHKITIDLIEQMKKDLDMYEKQKVKRAKIYSVIEHVGKKGRNDEIGKYQNNYNCDIQVALQYVESGQNYWKDEELNKEFNKTVSLNFERLLQETLIRVNLEYEKSKSIFDKYDIKDTK